MASNTAEPKIDVQVKQATVEEILDLLTKVSVSKIWIVTFEDSFILTSGGFRRTLSLWSNSPVSDNEQPVWDMFGWDSTIPSKSLKR